MHSRRNTATGRGRLRRTLLALAMSLAVVPGLLSTAQPAAAHTGDGSVNHVWLDLGDAPSSQQTIAYSTFLASLRAAVSDTWRDGTQYTQNASQQEGIVRVSLSAHDDSGNRRAVDLWVQPDNLYVVGYSPQGSGVSYTFSDASFNRAPVDTSITNLPFGGNYQALVQAAGRDRSSMPVWWNDIRASILQLANQTSANTNTQNTARSLMLLIQMTSEAARFNDLEGVFRAAVGDWGWGTNGLPAWQQNLENNWGVLSNFYWNLVGAGNTSTPTVPYVPGIGTIENTDQVRRYLRVLHTFNAGWNYPNPSRDEL
ncbi:ribosome-inactivating family protein [Streptomyces sp. WM6378]|uniref:ribosome-inactivating family protein n=1 Tax=Streptomyces sp. WM6378 TaxID=1415557 RepID=UPI000A843D18|nr:ribosome-inactivating family protein [Streptomyces sp. WM6378]